MGRVNQGFLPDAIPPLCPTSATQAELDGQPPAVGTSKTELNQLYHTKMHDKRLPKAILVFKGLGSQIRHQRMGIAFDTLVLPLTSSSGL